MLLYAKNRNLSIESGYEKNLVSTAVAFDCCHEMTTGATPKRRQKV